MIRSGIGISDEHVALSSAVAGWIDRHVSPAEVRVALEAPSEQRPSWWPALVDQGWTSLAVDERHGGDGYGLAELVVVLEAMGRACLPGPFLGTVFASLLLQAAGGEVADELLPDLAAGRRIGAVSMTGLFDGERTADGGVVLRGASSPVLGASSADVLLVPVRVADGVLPVAVEAGDLVVAELDSIDPTRRVFRLDAPPDGLPVAAGRILWGEALRASEQLAGLLVAAEAVGVADWCVHTAAEHAKVREQFGRPIGQFQAVKHRVADLLVDSELARAAVWDAARGDDDPEVASMVIAAAAGLAVDAAFDAAKGCIQVLGGIGFTWEHDAHLYLRRASSLRALLCGPGPWYAQAAELSLAGKRRRLAADLPPAADALRAGARADAARFKAMTDRQERRRAMADEGYVMPHWPAPWGRDAGPLEQIVIDDAFTEARVRRPHLQVGAWALPTLITHGTAAQQERWIRPTLHGDLVWCQLFSEPGAGSDLAGLSTKAVRTDGGWLLTGQKVWTTMAHEAHVGICLARTNPDAPKHQGITCFVIDMASDGIDIRPLKELTGNEMFNEVFLSDVFVSDDCVVGEVDDGWRVGRTTLANERVSMGEGASFGAGFEGLLAQVRASGRDGDGVVLERVGRLAAEEQALAVLGFRMALRALSGAEPGPESSVRKLAGVEHDQDVQEVGLELLAAAGAAMGGDSGTWGWGFLANRCLTIAGGTSEVQRNVIAERLLGLPRDP